MQLVEQTTVVATPVQRRARLPVLDSLLHIPSLLMVGLAIPCCDVCRIGLAQRQLTIDRQAVVLALTIWGSASPNFHNMKCMAPSPVLGAYYGVFPTDIAPKEDPPHQKTEKCILYIFISFFNK